MEVLMYIIRLDDACDKRDVCKWDKMEELLDKYNIKPIVGIIPSCLDTNFEKYTLDDGFWEKALLWQNKGWHIALHGFEHLFCTCEGGINPVNHYSEFAGVPLESQKEKIMEGVKILKDHGLIPKIFFAPAHTYDENTLLALKAVSDIRIVSDTVAYDCYCHDGITFIPQQSGKVRKLPFKTVTFCYHPNVMNEQDFWVLEEFIRKNHRRFLKCNITESGRARGLLDKALSFLYFARRK